MDSTTNMYFFPGVEA